MSGTYFFIFASCEPLIEPTSHLNEFIFVIQSDILQMAFINSNVFLNGKLLIEIMKEGNLHIILS